MDYADFSDKLIRGKLVRANEVLQIHCLWIFQTPLGGIHLPETKKKFLEGSLHPANVLMCPHTCVTNLPKPREHRPGKRDTEVMTPIPRLLAVCNTDSWMSDIHRIKINSWLIKYNTLWMRPNHHTLELFGNGLMVGFVRGVLRLTWLLVF